MVEIFDLKDKKPFEYYSMLTREGQESFDNEEAIVFGLSVDGKSAGAIAMEPDGEGAVNITSLYICPEFRRKGFGTELVYTAASYIVNAEGVYRIEATIAESDDIEDGDGLRKFFEWLDFKMEKDEEHGAYSVTIGDISGCDVISKAKPGEFYPYNRILSAVKNRVILEHPALTDAIGNGKIEEDMSFFADNDLEAGEMSDCIVFVREDRDIVMAWAQAENNKMNLVKLFRSAFEAAEKKYGPDQVVRIPYINENSKKLIGKILGDTARETEIVWKGVFPLETGEAKENTDIEDIVFDEA